MPTDKTIAKTDEMDHRQRVPTTDEIVHRPFEPDPDALPTRNRLDNLRRPAAP